MRKPTKEIALGIEELQQGLIKDVLEAVAEFLDESFEDVRDASVAKGLVEDAEEFKKGYAAAIATLLAFKRIQERSHKEKNGNKKTNKK